jgi:hypothetical protein
MPLLTKAPQRKLTRTPLFYLIGIFILIALVPIAWFVLFVAACTQGGMCM